MPARKQHYIIIYDIEDHKERRAIDRLLKGWGHRVQKSVFSVVLSRWQSQHLQQEIEKLKTETGSILMYRIQHDSKVLSFGLSFENPDDILTYII